MKLTINSPQTKIIDENPLWLSVSEAAKVGGVQTKTIRRAIKKDLKFKVKGNRYFITLSSLIIYLHQNTKLKNKLNEHGIGQYIKEWKNIKF
ncbi:MAG: helix-turn-helix domain-containing protein [Patescibacteria group bacterium]